MRLIFDRGTILCQRETGELAIPEINGTLWDERVGLWRGPAYLHAAIAGQLSDLGIPCRDDVNQLERLAPTSCARVPPLELRPYQESALDAWMLAGQRGVVVLPTGAGKTRLAIAAAARTRAPTLILVPTRVLLAQWLDSLKQAGFDSVGCFGDGERHLASVTVATFESALRHMARIGNRFALLVIDEVHHFAAGQRLEALEMCTAQARLGLTATLPEGPPDSPSSNSPYPSLEALVGPVVYRLSVGDLSGTYLAPYDIITLTLELTPEERRAYDQQMSRFRPLCRQFFRTQPQASWTDLTRAFSKSQEGLQALEAWRRARRMLAFTIAKGQTVGTLLARHRDGRVLVFTSDNDSTYEIARQFLVMPITCDIRRSERGAALSLFRTGGLKALVSAQVLNEGMDVPDADVAIVVGGTLGEREHVQRVGRLLRPAPGKRALIYELVTRATTDIRQAQRRRRGLDPRVCH